MVSPPAFLLAVGMLAISDAAPPKPPTFRELIEYGLQENIDALKLWDGLNLAGKMDLIEANKIFDEILKDEQGDHYYPLKKALRYELQALKEKKKCKSLSKKEKRDETACKKASSKIAVSLDAAPQKQSLLRDLVENGRRENQEALDILGQLAALVKTYLLEVNNILGRILENEKEDAYMILKTALTKELRALEQEKVECEVLRKIYNKDKFVCKNAAAKIASALLRIVMAIRETLPEESQKKKIEDIVRKGIVEGKGDVEDVVKAIVGEVLKILE
ncbi:unnamed protein product [Nippostrongylus brasiliensis]|uniref:Uncharacterized protein n=1 Tax=Nippostrongylus brasiliensis TaxID=27835 RepID=A0A158R0V8_NIPBR|nr:unnamed protein product [Nippostrongylus brasiliensis]